MTLQEARERAQAPFNKKEEAQREGQKAMQEYRANIEAQREKTARLKSLNSRETKPMKRRQLNRGANSLLRIELLIRMRRIPQETACSTQRITALRRQSTIIAQQP